MAFILEAKSYFFDPNIGLKPIAGENHIKQIIEEISYRYPSMGFLSFRHIKKSTWLNCLPNFFINQAKFPFRLGQNFVKEAYNTLRSEVDQEGNMYFKT